MKLVYIIAACLLTISCATDGNDCENKGPLCDTYQEDYFICRYYDHHQSYPNDYDNYPSHDYVEVYTWYKIMEDDWVKWYSYEKMYEHYCIEEEEPEAEDPDTE